MVWLAAEEHVFQHPWPKVVAAAMNKYPNPETPSVHSVDTIYRAVDSEGKLISTKIIGSKWKGKAIDIMTRITGLNLKRNAQAIEFSEVDVKNNIFKLDTRNFTLNDFISVDETLVYSVHNDRPDFTKVKQSWKVTCKNLRFNEFLENAMGKNLKSNASKGRAGIEYIIKKTDEEVQTKQETLEIGCDDSGDVPTFQTSTDEQKPASFFSKKVRQLWEGSFVESVVEYFSKSGPSF